MSSVESLETLNSRLVDYYGVDTISGDPIWRIVWSEDQTEKRLTHYTNSGVALLHPEVRELPKYRQWIQNKYVLERLTVVPSFDIKELPTTKTTYEPIFVFEDAHNNPLPVKWEVTQFTIDSIYAVQGKASLARYLPEEKDKNTAEGQRLRVEELEQQLYGNESPLGDALANKQSTVINPGLTKGES